MKHASQQNIDDSAAHKIGKNMTQVKTRTRPGPKPMDLDKRRVQLLRSQGISCYAIAKRFGVSTNVIWRAVNRWREDEALEKQESET